MPSGAAARRVDALFLVIVLRKEAIVDLSSFFSLRDCKLNFIRIEESWYLLFFVIAVKVFLKVL